MPTTVPAGNKKTLCRSLVGSLKTETAHGTRYEESKATAAADDHSMSLIREYNRLESTINACYDAIEKLATSK